jgi:hypothetical protein
MAEGSSGRFDRLFISNILPEEKKVIQISKEELNPELLAMQIEVLNTFVKINSPLLHHIKLLTQLREKEDYFFLNWEIQSRKNQAKVFEKRISKYRKFIITVQRTGTVVIDISCSNDPFDLCSIEGITEFYSVCGEIIGEIRNGTSRPLSDPLTTEVSNWILSQYDESFDIPTAELKLDSDSDSKSSNQGTFGWKFDGCMKVKYLSHLYQMYVKDTKKERILRIENRLSYPFTTAPTVEQKKRQLLCGMLDDILDELNIKDLECVNGSKIS